jgi:microcystin-dependent protein
MKRKPVRRTPRLGDGKLSFRPNDADHDGWLLLSSGERRMVGKVQYRTLFEVLGTFYGGTEASTTFGLPDARDVMLLMAGVRFKVGDRGGAETVKLTAAQMPKHKHSVPKVNAEPTANQGALLTSVLGIALGQITKPPTVTVSGTADTTEAGSGEGHENMPPYLAINVFIFAGMPPG